MVFLVYLYVLVATWLAFRLGRPLIRLNFLNQKLGADFRYALIRVREYAENIAFYQGTRVERGTLLARFAALIRNVWALVFRSLKFDGFNLGVDQVAVVFPFLLQAPRFFSGAIKLGDVMQTAQAFGQVQTALSFFRLSYDAFAQYRAALERLTGFVAANRESRELPAIHVGELADALEIDDLSVWRPDATPLLNDLNLRLNPGQTLLVQGASGSGKTTLLRSLAGLWPYARGTVQRPCGRAALFLSQRPYLPLGRLRTAVAYPLADADDAAAARRAAQGPARPSGRAARRGCRLVAHPVARRTAARRLRPRAAEPAAHRVPRRSHLGHRRRPRARALRPAARASCRTACWSASATAAR